MYADHESGFKFQFAFILFEKKDIDFLELFCLLLELTEQQKFDVIIDGASNGYLEKN